MKVDEWLQSNTFHHSAFWDINHIVEAKREQKLTVSLCIPTLNEETTIGKEIVVFRSELMERYPLLDEIAVIDSGSKDDTCGVAASFGADVYSSADILPDMGAKRGKGENLWKAIYQLEGDIIVYVDADIKNIHPRFVYGLLAPLIYRPEIKYVKAFYERPLAGSKGVRAAGGGRVTEILIRPLFSMFFPELAAIIQPLSGEYAVRREVLDHIPFPIGYGVETTHLIDVYQEHGLEAFGQTDLDRRVHRNQSTRDLGRMAFGILRVFLGRLREQGVITGLEDIPDVLQQFLNRDGQFERLGQEIREEERPPMIEVPAYRTKRGLKS
ncbi:MAG: glucosyl-3-phosphoglycerate synthase [Planctomycetota bacterium]|jgi:glucosyl-3-phosphoglycerate synthase